MDLAKFIEDDCTATFCKEMSGVTIFMQQSAFVSFRLPSNVMSPANVHKLYGKMSDLPITN